MLYRLMVLSSVILLTVISAPQSVMAQVDQGIECYNHWEYEKATELFQQVLQKEPADIQAGYYLGLSLMMQEKYQDALDILYKIKASAENSTKKMKSASVEKGQIEIAMARANLGLKKFAEALESINAAEREKADPVDIHTFKGAYFLETGRVDDAVGELEQAMELGSMNPYTYYYAGIGYLRQGKPDKSVKLLEAFLKMLPFAPEAVNAKILIDTLC